MILHKILRDQINYKCDFQDKITRFQLPTKLTMIGRTQNHMIKGTLEVFYSKTNLNNILVVQI